MLKLATTLATTFLVFPVAASLSAQEADRGLVLNKPGAFQGYTLFAPLGSQDTILIDMAGRKVHSWTSDYVPANSAFLLPNGDLLRAAKYVDNLRFGWQGPSGGRVEKFSWNGVKIWNFVYSNDRHHSHHDIEPLPNGNVLLIAWEHISRRQAIASGRRSEAVGPDGIWPDTIVEIQPTGPTTGEIVWQWRAWDHLIQDADPQKENFGTIAEHPELIDVNIAPRPRADWMHTNGVDYHPQLDQIMISLRSFGEIFIIDHSTTTEEAAGHSGGRSGRGGDLLYRWGNPANYGAGSASDCRLFGQHDPRWIRDGCPGAGHITIFNNGSQRPDGEYSTVEEIVPPLQPDGKYRIETGAAFGPTEPVWTFMAEDKESFFSSFISGAERLPNGNTLICAGATGEFFEVTAHGQVVWKYLNPVENRQSAPPTERESPGTVPARPRNRRQNRDGGPQNPHIVFRADRYAPDYPGLKDRELQPQD